MGTGARTITHVGNTYAVGKNGEPTEGVGGGGPWGVDGPVTTPVANVARSRAGSAPGNVMEECRNGSAPLLLLVLLLLLTRWPLLPDDPVVCAEPAVDAPGPAVVCPPAVVVDVAVGVEVGPLCATEAVAADRELEEELLGMPVSTYQRRQTVHQSKSYC